MRHQEANSLPKVVFNPRGGCYTATRLFTQITVPGLQLQLGLYNGTRFPFLSHERV